MSTLCMQALVRGKTVQVVVLPDESTAKIYIVDEDHRSHRPRTMSIRQYVESGMSDEDIAQHVVDVVSTSIEQLERLRSR
ncbi:MULTISPECIES: hypothetical protein [Burkholderia]|jgi:hypothetical protein|uniref:Uncharacterized protein n=2 Tax=Burkholderia multivorans TaxID=87883 RepID=A0A8E2RUN3_9BURK|nr:MULTISPECIES: hypothetical protein [Burkholderia]AJY15521.1 hypothetical protein NP80_3881 [Burkholderia multivorans ATCC BAA-247]AOJ96027.1 hypothetical protein WK22_24445 [Burkholderia multivorans]AVR19649.1 hypothetical protein A8H40_09615 [Burkholderia multivorans]EEE08286.1 conserved hypothetical protein [Burkholderia multivorans CGD2]EEE15972.1 conserved hypothetical protein [Burkholderia multivorans CGD2M]